MIKKISILFLSFILVLTSMNTVQAQADFYFITDTTDYAVGNNNHITDNNFCVDSNGYYYVWLWNDTTPHNFTLFKSVNSGDTWATSIEFDMSNDYDMQPDSASYYIDDNNIIHIAYAYGDGTGFNISYRNYNTATDTVSQKTHVYNVGGTYGCKGITILVNDDAYYKIAVGWVEQQSTISKMKCKIYNEQAEAWGDTKTIREVLANSNILSGLSGDILTNGTFVFAFQDETNTPTKRMKVFYYDDETDNSGSLFNIKTSSTTTGQQLDISIEDDDDIHLVYETTSSKINYSYYNDNADTWSNETLAEQTASKSPFVIINSDDTVQIVFIGDNGITPSDWVMGYYGGFGSWSSLQYYNSGITDDMDFPILPYQNQQEFTHLTDGVVGIYINTTNNEMYHFDEGYELFYGTGGGSYQGTPIGNESCPYYGNNEEPIDAYGPLQYTYYELRDYKSITAEITGFDLYITDNQRAISVLNDYTLYVRGLSRGSPDYFIDSGEDQYIVRWNFTTAVEMTDDIPLFELTCDAGLWGLWYYNIEIGPTFDTLRRHNSAVLFGNGVYDGDPGSQFRKIKYCYYYDTLTQEDPDPDDWYDDQTSDAWAEFFYYWRDCFYGVGDYPYIAYKIDSASAGSSPGIPGGNWNISLYYLGAEGTPTPQLISHRSVGHTSGNIIYGQNYLGSFPYEGNYVIYLYNCSHFTGDPNAKIDASSDLVHYSKPIRVCGVSQDINQYQVTITPQKNIYFVNDTVNIRIDRINGDDPWRYELTDPQFGNTRKAEGMITVDTVIIEDVNFASYLDYYYWAEGIWKLRVENSYDNNVGITINIEVVIEEDYTPYDQDEISFWIGLGLILVFTFIGVAVATKIDDGQLGVILLFAVIGGVISLYYGLIPDYALFLLGLLLVGYIVGKIFESRR